MTIMYEVLEILAFLVIGRLNQIERTKKRGCQL